MYVFSAMNAIPFRPSTVGIGEPIPRAVGKFHPGMEWRPDCPAGVEWGPMDAFLLKQVVAELAAELPGALVSKVRQPGEREIVLELWTGRGEKRLLLAADPELCRLHLTTRKAKNPMTPPRFCQFLRKHLEGMR